MADAKVAVKGTGTALSLEYLIRAKYPVIGIESKEERRVEAIIRQVADNIVVAGQPMPFQVRFWSITKGITDHEGKVIYGAGEMEGKDPVSCLNYVCTTPERAIYVFRDIHPMFEDYVVRRSLRDTAKQLKGVKKEVARTVILLSPELNVPKDLEADIHKMPWPLPKRDELMAVLEKALKNISDEGIKKSTDKDAVVGAALGLTVEEASSAFARSIVETGKLDPALIVQEKKQKIAKSGSMRWLDPIAGGLKEVGDLENVREWLGGRRDYFGPEAAAYGLKPVKGIVLAGVGGTGKTYIARALGGEWDMPVIAVNFAAMQSGIHGGSEQNLLQVFETLEVCAPCIALFDELDKNLGSGHSINEVENRTTGTLMSWLQDRTAPIFVIGTMNDIDRLEKTNPAALRKGRWDEKFFVGLHSVEGRKQIFDVHVSKVKFKDAIDTAALAVASKGFVGAEIEAVVNDAMGHAFRQNRRKLTTADLLAEIKATVPQSKSAAGRITELMEWAKTNAKMASRADVEVAAADDEREVEAA